MAKAAGSGFTRFGEKIRLELVECGSVVSGRRQSLMTPEDSIYLHFFSLFLTLNNPLL